MGPSFTDSCSNTVYGYGDNTAGPIWKYWLPEGQTPLGGPVVYTNYPYGETLYSPVNYSNILQSTLIWGLSEVAGPFCGYNMVTALGFLSAALVMFGFIYWLTRNRWVAWLAGYAVSFVPYFQYKVGGHPSYGYHALLIGALWLFFKVLKDRRKKDALLLGVVSAACFFWDPYFSMLILLTLIPVTVAWAAYRFFSLIYGSKSRRKQVKKIFLTEFKRFLLCAGVVAVLVAPLAAVRVLGASQIEAYVGSTRGDPIADATGCSILPWDYFLPANNNWFVTEYLSTSYTERIQILRHRCGPSEATTGIAFIVLGVLSVGGVILAWEKANDRRLFKRGQTPDGIDIKIVVLGAAVMVLSAAILALPPALGNIKFPSFYMLDIAPVWRILTRMYLVVNIGVITLFSITLLYFNNWRWFKNHRAKVFALGLIFILMFMQYQAFAPLRGARATFNYKEDVSEIYYWLRDQKDINFIAAYPMDRVGESEAIGHYLTYQTVHGKVLLNSAIATSPQERMRYSLKDLSDPQTLPVLRGLGVQALEIHGLTPGEIERIPGLTVLVYDDQHNPLTGGKKAIARIEDGPKQDFVAVMREKFPYNRNILRSAVDAEYEAERGAVIVIEDIFKDDRQRTVDVCFEVKTADPKDEDEFWVTIDGVKVVQPVSINGNFHKVSFKSKEGQRAILNNNTGHNMRINDLGCPVR
jgi:hypothetical protein